MSGPEYRLSWDHTRCVSEDAGPRREKKRDTLVPRIPGTAKLPAPLINVSGIT